jgi:hypothetical protein
MKWTTDRPTKPGWYWYRPKGGKTRHILQVRGDLTVHGINTYADHVDECDGKWQGPLVPHEEA